jgi:F-type H+-transporting ATPase subunit b
LKQNSQQIGSTFRFCKLALLLMLSAATATTPLRAMAWQQSNEPPAQPSLETPAQEAQHPPHTPAQKAEEQENDQYRHAPVVQSLARLLHMDVETAARTFEIFNVSVVVLGIVIPLVRIMPRLLRKRSQQIQVNLEEARKTTEDANRRLSAVEAKLASLDQEIARFRTEVEEQIAQDEQRGKSALEEEKARIVASAEAEIGVAAAQARRSLRHFAADLAIEQAAKQLVLTPDTDRALIAEFVSDAARDGMNGGGKQ